MTINSLLKISTQILKILRFLKKRKTLIFQLLQLNSTYPLEKQNQLYQNILTPKVSIKIAPNHTKNYKDDENKINVNNIYSLNRINKNDTIEGGLSLAYGADYNLIDKTQMKKSIHLRLLIT